ncbi:MAG: 5'/3'-nucleotidase SurE [Desulfococcaceae bacterium]
MKFVIANDDGIDAPGLAALAEILRPLGRVVVVAPAEEQSGVGHRVTTWRPIHVTAEGPDRYRVAGSPADCARIALKSIAPDADWVVSGINPGANLGSDVYNSGTVAAAREAAILGGRGMAVSQYIARGHGIDWSATADHAGRVIRRLLKRELAPDHFWNVNLPHPLASEDSPEIAFRRLDPRPHRYRFLSEGEHFRYEGSIHERPFEPDSDVEACYAGYVSVTRIAVGTTPYK